MTAFEVYEVFDDSNNEALSAGLFSTKRKAMEWIVRERPEDNGELIETFIKRFHPELKDEIVDGRWPNRKLTNLYIDAILNKSVELDKTYWIVKRIVDRYAATEDEDILNSSLVV